MRLFITLTLACLVSACATSSPSRTAALDLHRRLGQSRVVESHPEEYRSFLATISRAEMLAQGGESLQSDNVYRLALIKGRLLEMRSSESAPAGTVERLAGARADAAATGRATPADRLPVSGAAETSPVTPSQVEAAGTAELPVSGDPAAPLSEPAPEITQEAVPVAPQSGVLTDSPDAAVPHPASGADLLPPLPGEELPTADMRRFIGSRGYYTVKRGESLKRVAARLGVEWRQLARINGLASKAQLKPGQVLAYDNRKIVPAAVRDGIVINIADRTLYLLKNGTVRTSYPVAVGKPPRPEDDEDWSTPTGRFIITSKAKDPVWKVPKSIQDEMEQRGKEPVKEVPPGKDNPLGKYAMKTSLSGIVIHSTNAPSSIYSYTSHGCIRVMPEHMEQLYPSVEPRASGIIVYQPVKLAISPDGRIFLEVNRDVYGRYGGGLEGEVRKLVARRSIESRIDWDKVDRILKKKSGIPEEITRHGAEAFRKNVPGTQKSVAVSRAGIAVSLP